jgi:DNA-binding MarR family transcriptional regulator
MNPTEHKITQSILEHTNDYDVTYSALIHWRWSQFERLRRSIIRVEFRDLLITNTEEYSILVYIDLNSLPTLTDVANYLTMEKSTVSEFIKRCMNKELIKEEQSTKDKRKRFYSLTEKGKEVLLQCHVRMQTINDRLFSSLNKDEKQDVLKLLVRLNS